MRDGGIGTTVGVRVLAWDCVRFIEGGRHGGVVDVFDDSIPRVLLLDCGYSNGELELVGVVNGVPMKSAFGGFNGTLTGGCKSGMHSDRYSPSRDAKNSRLTTRVLEFL